MTSTDKLFFVSWLSDDSPSFSYFSISELKSLSDAVFSPLAKTYSWKTQSTEVSTQVDKMLLMWSQDESLNNKTLRT